MSSVRMERFYKLRRSESVFKLCLLSITVLLTNISELADYEPTNDISCSDVLFSFQFSVSRKADMGQSFLFILFVTTATECCD